MLFSGEYAIYLKPGQVDRKAEKSEFVKFTRESIDAWKGSVSPFHIPHEVVQDYEKNKAKATITRLTDGGWSYASETSDYTFAPDLSFRSSVVTNPVGARQERIVTEDRKSSAMSARFPVRVISRQYAKGSNEPGPTFEYIYSEPVRTSTPDRSAFEWWTYADRSKEFNGTAVLGPNNIPIVGAEADSVSAASASNESAMHVDRPKDFALRPDASLKPRSDSTVNQWLLAIGISCVVMAAAVFIRRRSG
jgi:hypothetical protein